MSKNTAVEIASRVDEINVVQVFGCENAEPLDEGGTQ
jgi:hypothetical protein